MRDLWIDSQHLVRIVYYLMSELALLLKPLAPLMPIMRSGRLHLIKRARHERSPEAPYLRIHVAALRRG